MSVICTLFTCLPVVNCMVVARTLTRLLCPVLPMNNPMSIIQYTQRWPIGQPLVCMHSRAQVCTMHAQSCTVATIDYQLLSVKNCASAIQCTLAQCALQFAGHARPHLLKVSLLSLARLFSLFLGHTAVVGPVVNGRVAACRVYHYAVAGIVLYVAGGKAYGYCHYKGWEYVFHKYILYAQSK